MIEVVDAAREDEEGGDADGAHNDEPAEEEQEVGHFVQHDHADGVAQQQVERLAGRRAKVGAANGAHDVRVPVDKAHKRLQAPKQDQSVVNNAINYPESTILSIDLPSGGIQPSFFY